MNRTKLPVIIQLIEVRTPMTEADRRRLAPARCWGFKKLALSAWMIDQSKREVWTNAYFNGRLTGRRFYERLVREPRESDAHMAQARPAISFNTGPAYVTYALLALLAGVFAAECLLALTPPTGLWRAGIRTLLAFGGVNRSLVESGEWYRLFTAMLVHADVFHLLMNGVALFFAGRLLEGLVGRAWFAALFVIGGLGGSLLSIAINDPNIVSVGASGAIMALAASAFTVSFRLGPTVERNAIQTGLLNILIPSLLPLATHGAKVDYAAHVGGAVTGIAVGLVILQTWARTSPLPALRQFALAVAIAGIGVAAYAVEPLSRQYQTYKLAALLIPKDKLPTTNQDAKARSAELVERYPRDPRARLYRALALHDSHADDDAEQQLRLALTDEPVLKTMFKPELESDLRTLLVALLVERGKASEARDIARPVCAGELGNVPASLAALNVCDAAHKATNP